MIADGAFFERMEKNVPIFSCESCISKTDGSLFDDEIDLVAVLISEEKSGCEEETNRLHKKPFFCNSFSVTLRAVSCTSKASTHQPVPTLFARNKVSAPPPAVQSITVSPSEIYFARILWHLSVTLISNI